MPNLVDACVCALKIIIISIQHQHFVSALSLVNIIHFNVIMLLLVGVRLMVDFDKKFHTATILHYILRLILYSKL